MHRIDNGLRDLAFVEAVRTVLGDLAQGRGIFGVLVKFAFLQRRAIGVIEMRLDVGHAGAAREGLDGARQLGPDGKAVIGQLDGGREQPGPGQLAVFLMRQPKHAHHAGNPHRQPARNGFRFGAWLAIGIQEHGRRGAGGRQLAAVKAGGLTGFGIVDQHEGAAADAAGFRLHQAQHQLGGDGRIHRAAAGAHHVEPRLRGMGIGGGDHVFLGDGLGHLCGGWKRQNKRQRNCQPLHHDLTRNRRTMLGAFARGSQTKSPAGTAGLCRKTIV